MIMLSVGSIFAQRYRVVRLIGQGGMGAVFEVIHLETERRCALKVMQPNMVDNEAMRVRFRQEAKVAALVNSEHIVDVYDAGFDEATQMPFLVMELLQGIELRQQLKKVGRLRPDEVALYLYQTALALEKTHRSNIIHRDLKPENLYLTFRENGAPHVKVLDFGVAKFMTETGANTSATRDVGTPLYMSPEQFTMGTKASPQSDIYALGMIAYTLLTGVSYWADDPEAGSTIYAFALHAVNGPRELASVRAARRGVQLPQSFDHWFNRATARDPSQRFPTALIAANELADALGVPRTAVENSMAISSGGIRAAVGSSWGALTPAPGLSGSSAGAMTPMPNQATGAPLATTTGQNKESKNRVIWAAVASGSLVFILGLAVIFGTSKTAPPTPPAAAANPPAATTPAPTATTPPPAATNAPETAPTEPASSASAMAAATTAPAAPQSTSKSTNTAKPAVTTAPKKDLFTRD